MAVLILAPGRDEHAVVVGGEIARHGVRSETVDLALFPERGRLVMDYDGAFRQFRLDLDDGRRLDLAEFGSVWWRRPHSPRISEAIARPSHRLFAANEAQEALTGLWRALDAQWVNDPNRDDTAHRKAYQLRVAQDVGLAIPRTLITNDPDEARRFAAELGPGKVVYKAFSATEEEWRETRVLRETELPLLDMVRHAPVIFQEYVPAIYDLRITLVGDEVFPVAIHSQETEYPVDCRIDIANARLEATTLPPGVERLLRALRERLGIVYGAVDMRRTPDDRYVFLEVNPAGQWLYVEAPTGLPIAAAMARTLIELDRAIPGASQPAAAT
jgi:glutathione synthase/RimK-type ligase-like ATP-grasp enzyme